MPLNPKSRSDTTGEFLKAFVGVGDLVWPGVLDCLDELSNLQCVGGRFDWWERMS